MPETAHRTHAYTREIEVSYPFCISPGFTASFLPFTPEIAPFCTCFNPVFVPVWNLMPGPAPKPSKLKLLQGNPGHKKLNKAEPVYTGQPICPSWITKTAKTEWKRIVKELESLDLLRAVDSSALAAYCQSFARWRSAEEIVDAEGQTVQEPVMSKAGEVVGYKTKRHPATIIAKDEKSSMHRAAALFGFDPSSRSRIVLPEQNLPVDTDDDFNLYAAPADGSRIVH